jgi:hypothetical protein
MQVWRVFNKTFGECFKSGTSQNIPNYCHFGKYSHSLNLLNSQHSPNWAKFKFQLLKIGFKMGNVNKKVREIQISVLYTLKIGEEKEEEKKRKKKRKKKKRREKKKK